MDSTGPANINEYSRFYKLLLALINLIGMIFCTFSAALIQKYSYNTYN